ncbi:MAG: hypothetical protein V1850_00650 [Candidatus Bathyarchaeota archaeon]
MRRGAKQISREKARTGLRRASSGEFTNFSSITHGWVRATFDDHPAKIQRSIIHALRKLNGLSEEYPISISGRAGTLEGTVSFEVGVAEGVYFTYLDDEAVKKLCESIGPRRAYPILDFLIIITYHCSREGKTVRINFDYHQLRFLFNNNSFEMRLFHSKGIRRMPLDEFVDQVLKTIKNEMKQESLEPLTIEEREVL